MEDYATRKELNGIGKRLDEVMLLKPVVTRNEADIQKIFGALDKIPENNSQLIKDIEEKNQKLLTKIGVAIFISIGVATWALIAQ